MRFFVSENESIFSVFELNFFFPAMIFGCEIEMAIVYIITKVLHKYTRNFHIINNEKDMLVKRQKKEIARIQRRKGEEVKIRKKYFPEAPSIPKLTPEMLNRVEKAWKGSQGKIMAELGANQCTGADLQTLVGKSMTACGLGTHLLMKNFIIKHVKFFRSKMAER